MTAARMPTKIYLHTVDHVVVGRVAVEMEDDHLWYVRDVYVSPAHRRRGIGTFLMRQLLRDADEDRTTLYLYACALPADHKAGGLWQARLVEWYEGLGFEQGEDGMERRPHARVSDVPGSRAETQHPPA